MNVYKYSLLNISEKDRDFFVDMLSYVSEHILEIHSNSEYVEIAYTGISEKELLASISELENMIKWQLKKNSTVIKSKTLFEHKESQSLNTSDVFSDMLSKGNVREVSSGAFAYSGVFLKIYKYFCEKIEKQIGILFPEIKKEVFEVPALTPIIDYDEGQYFETFPHHIMFQTMMKNDLKVMERFSENGAKDPEIFREIKIPKNILRTAACAPIYPFFRNEKISEKAPKCIMVSGKCFRNEGNNVETLARLNEFYMKEYVFIGTPKQVKSYIERATKLWELWTDIFDLNCKVETANDSFFASNYKKLQFFQMIGDSKREFKCLIPYINKYISCSSANFHRTHFTKIYNIRTEETEAYCHSACFAFGIDRLAYALLSQKGLDISKWDIKVTKEIEKYITL